ncbi:hypothetical protein FOPG_18039 [Fusarium oxysporum f. sp. conglutinans race 2 54008]|uniref:Uncharacterized protein n=1 Tax=Fusarium oxysporum f. sp. conglutinans race 2 54008 TaxID=1089457 RepID=X0GQ60_FUSOX|nr:hypothetical protein FOPG_18039 [Fusarium oxysporum f. sp. conglutinans race 2 54008]
MHGAWPDRSQDPHKIPMLVRRQQLYHEQFLTLRSCRNFQKKASTRRGFYS